MIALPLRLVRCAAASSLSAATRHAASGLLLLVLVAPARGQAVDTTLWVTNGTVEARRRAAARSSGVSQSP